MPANFIAAAVLNINGTVRITVSLGQFAGTNYRVLAPLRCHFCIRLFIYKMAPQPKQNSKRGKKMRKYKHHTLYIVIIVMLFGLITVNNSDDASSLSYQSNIDIGFTFLPTLNVSLSSDSLTINNLIPGGNAADSNTITINVSTNIAEGYNLYAAVGNSNNGTTNLTNVSNNNYTFTPLSSNISELSNFTNNTWGYSYCVSNCSSASTPDTPNNTPKKGIKLSGIGVSLHNMMLKKEDNKKKEAQSG